MRLLTRLYLSWRDLCVPPLAWRSLPEFVAVLTCLLVSKPARR